MTQRTKVWLIAIYFLSGATAVAQSDSFYPDRKEMQEHYRDQLADQSIFLRSAPTHHIAPVKKSITFIGRAEYDDVTIRDDFKFPEVKEHELTLKGYSVTPIVAFTTKNFGLGFGAEYAKKTAAYSKKGNGFNLGTESRLTGSGLSAYAYHIPGFGLWSNTLTLTLIGGVASYNAEQELGEPIYGQQELRFTKYRYQAQRTNFGVNMGFRFIKAFAVIPWYDVAFTRLGDIKSGDGENLATPSHGASGTQEILEADRELFWTIAPRQSFGIDLAISIGRLEFNIGGLLGAIGGLASGSDRIKDSGGSVNISFSMKAR